MKTKVKMIQEDLKKDSLNVKRLTWKSFLNGEYYKIDYTKDVNGEILEPIRCAMCIGIAYGIAPETREPLCLQCIEENNEARSKKYKEVKK